MIPDWPRLIYSHPQAAYSTFQDCLTWLEDTAVILPGPQCVLCTEHSPRPERGLCPSCYRKTARLEDFLYLTGRGVNQAEALTRLGQNVTDRTINRNIAKLRRLTEGNRLGVPPQLLQPELPGLTPDVHDHLARLTWLAADFPVTEFPQAGADEDLTTAQLAARGLTTAQVADAAGVTRIQVSEQVEFGRIPATRYRGSWRVTPAVAAVYARQLWLTADVTQAAA